MLQKLKILMLLATIVPESLSAPTNQDDTRNETLDLPALTKVLDYSVEEMQKLIKNVSFLDGLDRSPSKFASNLMKALVNGPFSQLDQSISKFNSNLMTQLVKSAKGNILISPLSIHLVLAMLYYASPMGTSTHSEIAEVLGLKDERIEYYLADIYKMQEFYETHDTGLAMANGIFLKGGINIEPEFKAFLKAFFKSTPDSLDSIPSKAIEQVNNFVKTATNGLIKNIVSPGNIVDRTRMVLINTLYHTDTWKYPFNAEMTNPMPFTRLDGTVVYPEGMWQVNDKLRMGESVGLGCRILELPYTNGFRMYILLPKENSREALDRVATWFDYEEVQEYLDFEDNGIEVVMPRLEIHYSEDVAGSLATMGLSSMFSSLYGGDYSHMTDTTGLIVNGILHKSTIIVNEEGSETASATAITICTRDCSGPKKFLINRPFTISIVDTVHGVSVVSGVVVDPTEKVSPDEAT